MKDFLAHFPVKNMQKKHKEKKVDIENSRNFQKRNWNYNPIKLV